MGALTVRFYLNEGAMLVARRFGAFIALAWRTIVVDQVRSTADVDAFYRERVPNLRQSPAPWREAARYAWRGICPICRADALYVDPWTGLWLCAEGACPPRGPLAPVTLGLFLGESQGSAPALLPGLREQYDAADLSWRFAEAAARDELGGDRAPPT